jgi:hypothetical protein
MPTGDLTLYTSGYSLLEKTKLAQSEQRRQETLDSSGRPKVERFFIEDTYSVVAPRAAAPSIGVSTTTFTSDSFTTDFATSPTPTVFPTPSPSPSAGIPSGFIPDFSSDATEFADPSQAAGGGPDLVLDSGYGDEPNQLRRKFVVAEDDEEDEDGLILKKNPTHGFVGVSGLMWNSFNFRSASAVWTGRTGDLFFEEFNSAEIVDSRFKPEFEFLSNKGESLNTSVSPDTIFENHRFRVDWTLRYRGVKQFSFPDPEGYEIFRSDSPYPFDVSKQHRALFPQRTELAFSIISSGEYSNFYGVFRGPSSPPRVANISTSCTPEHIYITRGYVYCTYTFTGLYRVGNPDWWDFWGVVDSGAFPPANNMRYVITDFAGDRGREDGGADIRYDVIAIRVTLPRTGLPGGQIEYRKSSILAGAFSANVFDIERKKAQHFFDSMYDGDPLKAITKVRQSESSNWDADILNWDPQELWPSTLSYNSQTGLARAIVQRDTVSTTKNFVTFEKTLPTGLTSREVATLITAARPFTFDAYNNPNSGFTAISGMEGGTSAGILYDEIYPLNDTPTEGLL